MEYFILAVLILLIGAAVSLVVKEEYKLKIATVISFIAFSTALFPILHVLIKGVSLSTAMFKTPVFGVVNLLLDPLSAIFGLIICVMGFLGLIYANGYLKAYFNKGCQISAHVFSIMLLFASMLLVTVANHGLFFLVSWEIMSLSSFFLVIFENENKSVIKSGIKYLMYMHLSGAFLLAMFAILTGMTNSFSFTDYTEFLHNQPQIVNLIFTLGFIGFGLKAGFVPFHNWLPDAHPAAPTHVSGIMSGIMIKTGVYGILRLIFMIGTPSKEIGFFVLAVAVITALYGVLYATTQQDLKRILAYSSIENIGISGIGIGIGILGLSFHNILITLIGFGGAILHVLNHSIFKEILFFSVGNIYQKTHTRNIEMLGGLVKTMPYTALFFIIGSASICAFPLLNGFVSEFLIYASMFLSLPIADIGMFITIIVSIASLAMVGTMAILCFTKLSGVTLLGSPRNEASAGVKSDVSLQMIIPIGILSVFALLIGLFPQYVVRLIFCPASSFINFATQNEVLPILNRTVSLFNTISILLVVFLAILLVCFGIKYLLCRKNTVYTTWGCGYNKPSSAIQYTASSYVNPFVAMLKPLFKRVSHIKKPKELFPKEAYYEQVIEDIEEAYIVSPLVKWDEKILTKFERIQNGNIQQYILFGLIFLILSLIGVFLFG